jgi:RNA polymerase sigma-70 factor, ECF subfamily
LQARGDVRDLSFVEVYGAFEPRIRRYLTRLVGRTEAEDLTQEVFAKVSHALPRFRGDAKLSTWLYRIATNAARDRARSPAYRRPNPLLQIGRPAPERAPAVEQTVARKEMSDCVRLYLDRLPESYRSIILLSEEEELTNQQIAEALGISLDAVKIRLHRARTRLRKELGGGCDLYRDDRNELACQPKMTGVSPAG